MILHDPERPKEGVWWFFSGFRPATHILKVNYTEMAGDRPRQPAYEIFTIKRRFKQSKSRPSGFKEACASRSQKRLPLKVAILPLLARLTWK